MKLILVLLSLTCSAAFANPTNSETLKKKFENAKFTATSAELDQAAASQMHCKMTGNDDVLGDIGFYRVEQDVDNGPVFPQKVVRYFLSDRDFSQEDEAEIFKNTTVEQNEKSLVITNLQTITGRMLFESRRVAVRKADGLVYFQVIWPSPYYPGDFEKNTTVSYGYCWPVR